LILARENTLTPERSDTMSKQSRARVSRRRLLQVAGAGAALGNLTREAEAAPLVHPEELRYSWHNIWVRVKDNRVTMGLTDYAQHELGDVVYLALPEVGRKLKADELFGTVESVKAVLDMISPVTGEVVEVNEPLTHTPEEINSAPYGSWMIVVKQEEDANNPCLVSVELARLLTAAQYKQSRNIQ
jgi:glycine cleavage system H protein